MFLDTLVIFLGLAGLLVCLFGPGADFFRSTSSVRLYPAPEVDFVVEISTHSVGEPLWSSFTLEILRLVVFAICFLTILALIGEFGEKRILAFLIMVEVLLVFLATLVVLTGSTAGFNIRAHYNTALCILAAGGADTALALALFMTYFKISGETTLK